MNRRYLELAGISVCAAATVLALSGCWSRSPRPADQAYSTTIYTAQGAPVYNSDSEWQRGVNPGPPANAGQPVREAAGSQAQPQQTQGQVRTQTQQPAPVSSSSQLQTDDSYKLESPRMSDQAPHANVPARKQSTAVAPQSQSSTSYSAATPVQSSSTMQGQSQKSSTASTQYVTSTPMITEGPNSGGHWNPGLIEGTRGPDASIKEGWLPGYHNPEFQHQAATVHEAAGADMNSLQRQINAQQRQLNQQQQQINQQQRQLNQLNQPAPSPKSSAP